MHDAGRTGVDQPANAVAPAGFDHMVGAVDVNSVKFCRIAPNARFASCVHNRITASSGDSQTVWCGYITAYHPQAWCEEVVRIRTLKGDYLVIQAEKLAADRTTEESPAASDQDFQNAGVFGALIVQSEPGQHTSSASSSWPIPTALRDRSSSCAGCRPESRDGTERCGCSW